METGFDLLRLGSEMFSPFFPPLYIYTSSVICQPVRPRYEPTLLQTLYFYRPNSKPTVAYRNVVTDFSGVWIKTCTNKFRENLEISTYR